MDRYAVVYFNSVWRDAMRLIILFDFFFVRSFVCLLVVFWFVGVVCLLSGGCVYLLVGLPRMNPPEPSPSLGTRARDRVGKREGLWQSLARRR
jgi:hypothetical protein